MAVHRGYSSMGRGMGFGGNKNGTSGNHEMNCIFLEQKERQSSKTRKAR